MAHLTQPEPPDVVLIDPVKGDYRRLVRELGGQIVRLSSRPEVVINPFDLPPAAVVSGTGETAHQNPVMEQTRLATGLVALMAAEEGEHLRKAERSVVESAILAAYRARGIDPDNPDTWAPAPEAVPVLADVLAHLEQLAGGAPGGSPVARSLADRLRPFCTGTLSGLFDRPTNLRLDAGLTSFDLEGLDSELRPLAVWTIGNHVWKVAKQDRRKRILCLDEVKTLLEHPESARLVAHLYALGRAYNLSVWSMSQLLSDYMATPEGERALQNAHTVLLLRQAAGKGAEDAQGRYGLSGDDRLYLEACGRGQGLLVTPRGHVRLQITPSLWELALMGGPPAEPAAAPVDEWSAASLVASVAA
jgi:type IV secretory pathway VirB4 component